MTSLISASSRASLDQTRSLSISGCRPAPSIDSRSMSLTSDPAVLVRSWVLRYPDTDPLIDASENALAREREDEKLGCFLGLTALGTQQVRELIDWKFQSMPHRAARTRKA